MNRKTIDESFNGGIKISGQPVSRRLVGQYSRDWNTYTLREYWKIGKRERMTGEWIVENVQAQLAVGFSPEEQARERMEESIEYRDMAKLLESFL